MSAEHPFSTDIVPERAIVVGVDTGAGDWDVEASLAELSRLAQTAGAQTAGMLTQRLDHPLARTFIGTGKVRELKDMTEALDADVVIFDDELSPSQQSNLERALGMRVKVIDRTALILDIFGLHATTHEGKLQVQMAQLKYLYPRLRGMWAHLAKDKTRGGIGSRFGQGESQLEVDRRLIRDRMSILRRELARIDRRRGVQRKERWESAIFRVSLAGYTNAGKSTLLNCLTGAGVYVQDQLFATLDATTRVLALPGGREVTITDTVGFIQKLPHTLVESFKSTLTEVSGADLILKVVDATDEHKEQQLQAVEDVLGEIGAHEIPTLTVYNKCDLLEAHEVYALRAGNPEAIYVSAVNGMGIAALLQAISDAARARNEEVEALIPYNQGALVRLCHESGNVLSAAYEEQGTVVRVVAPPELRMRLEPYRTDMPAAIESDE